MLRYLLYNLIISFVKEFVNMAVNYRKTLISCYLGFITQAIAANFAPLLFLTFHNGYGIPFGKIALISSVFFVTQLIIDVLCARFADKIGYRKCVIGSQVFSALGLIGLAFLPELLPNPFSGIIISTVIYAMGSGLTEVLVSPIVEACPFEHKEAAMSLLHSFYCWGSVGVILISTLFFTVFGIENWKWLSCIWAIIPLVNVYNFSVCPIAHPVEDGEGMRIRDLLRVPLFWLAILLMVCAGASELSMAQWASAFAESALGLTKSVGDIAGPCMFAVTMGISRTLYGKYGEKLDLMKFMIGSALLCLICYITASLSGIPVIGLLGCIMCGFSVGIMWPGSISICSGKIPTGGTAMFALLAMAGDLGGALGPAIVGNITQNAGNDMQKGMLAGFAFPLILMISLLLLNRVRRRNN